MRKYEVTYIISPELGDEEVPGVIEKYKNQVTEQGGQVVDVNENLGKRKFAYEIKDKSEGYYVTMRFDAESDVEKELRRVMQLSDVVLRSLIVCVN